MASSELLVVENKLKAPPISKLDAFQQLSAIRTLILKITVITGWNVPQAEMIDILSDQFLKLILERYAWINVLEIEYAFRNHGTRVKDWGKEMNLGLITNVLDSYLDRMSEIVENAHKTSPIESEEHIFTDEEMDNEIRGKIQAFLDYKHEGKKTPLWLDHWAEILVKDGFIKEPEQAEDFLRHCMDKNIKKLYVKD